MKFEEALQLVKDGKSVRRKSWGSKRCHIYLNCVERVAIDNGYDEPSGIFDLMLNDIKADDWEEYYIPVLLSAEEKEYLKTVINNWPFSIETLSRKIDVGSKEHSRSDFIVFSDAAGDYSGEIAIKSNMFRGLRENISYSLKELGL